MWWIPVLFMDLDFTFCPSPPTHMQINFSLEWYVFRTLHSVHMKLKRVYKKIYQYKSLFYFFIQYTLSKQKINLMAFD